MEIDQRIITLIEILGLTSGEFADKINVQRSSISHITSARNKPSIDFLERALTTFPEINSEWLILGKGKPLKNKVENNEENTVQPTLLFPSDDIEDNLSNRIGRAKDEKVEVEETKKEDKEEELKIINSIINRKEVKKIIILYKDNSFDLYEN